jgi:LPXTG-site transpeptidase (sortase) family protein
MLVLVGGVIIIFAIWQWLETPVNTALGLADGTPTLPTNLTRADVLPTPTLNPSVPLRQIIFPSAQMSGAIVDAYRVGDSWDVRYLGTLVGHLVGTSWLDDPGGNIALVGHVEDAEGKPGPFAYLSQAKVGDLVILQDGQRQIVYHVFTVTHAAPEDIQFVAQDGHRRLTLITCSDWDVKTASYLSRLVVVAVPVL